MNDKIDLILAGYTEAGSTPAAVFAEKLERAVGGRGSHESKMMVLARLKELGLIDVQGRFAYRQFREGALGSHSVLGTPILPVLG